MLRATKVRDVTEIKMGRSLDGRAALYWVAAYLIDAILIDTGCDYTKEELAEFLSGKQLSMIINTHYHEDHVGGNALLRERFGLRALAHPVTIPLMNREYDLYPYERDLGLPCAVHCRPGRSHRQQRRRQPARHRDTGAL